MQGDGALILSKALALGVLLAFLLLLAETRLYPIAFGAVFIAGLYVLLEHSDKLTSIIGWSTSTLNKKG